MNGPDRGSVTGRPAPGGARRNPRTTVNVCVVGCGAIAQIVHLPILSHLQGVRVASICEPDRPKAETLAERLGVPAVFETLDRALEDPSLHAVVICTPNHLHARQTEEALRAGKHVLCERPLGIGRDEVARVLATARESGRRLLVAHNHRYRPDVIAVREAVARGDVGELYHAHAVWRRRRSRRPRPPDWRRDPAKAGGGVLYDQGIQMLDLGLWVLGYPAPRRLSAHLRRLSGDEIDDVAIVLLELAGGTTLSVEVMWSLAATEDEQSLQALGTRGSLSLSPFRVQKESRDEIVDVTPELRPAVENLFTASYRRELDHFMEVARGDQEVPLPDEQEMLMAIVEACYRSADEGREIVL